MHVSFAKAAKNSVPLHAIAAQDLKAWAARFRF